MKVVIEFDTLRGGPTEYEKAILLAVAGQATRLILPETLTIGEHTVDAEATEVAEPTPPPAAPVVEKKVESPHTVDTSKLDTAKAAGPVLVASRPSATDLLVPTETVHKPAATVAPAETTPPADTAPAGETVSREMVANAITAFIADKQVGGVPALQGVLKRYGDATGLSGARPVPPEKYGDLLAELTQMMRVGAAAA